MTVLGLFIILFAWILQLLALGKKSRISVPFVISYSIGVCFMVIDSVMTGLSMVGVLNLLILIVTIFVMAKLDPSQNKK